MLNGGSGGHVGQPHNQNQNNNYHHQHGTQNSKNVHSNVPPSSKVHHGSHSLSTSHNLPNNVNSTPISTSISAISSSQTNSHNSSAGNNVASSSSTSENDNYNNSNNKNNNDNSCTNGSTGSSSHNHSSTTTSTISNTSTEVADITKIKNNIGNLNNAIVATSKALMLTNGSGLYKVFSTESVLNLLHCLYCKKPYRDPRLLHCGHTYCLPCLIQMNRYSTIRCIKCNSLHTVTSHAVETLPKNLFVADIQCIPTVEIDRGAAYKETLKSLEELKFKLLDFSDRFDQSEEKLVSLAEIKKIEVSQQIARVIDQIKQLEDEFHNEIEEFKNNRLAVLRSAPAEFKETNENLLQFVNQSLDDMMRPDIKEEDVKEIYNRCEEHRRLWNETEIIFNSNYAIGEIHFAINEKPISKEIIGNVIQKLPQKLSAQRTAKGPISISECCVDGDYIVIENTSKRHDVNMTNWILTHCVGSVRKISFKFPDAFILKSRQSVKMWAGNKPVNVTGLGSHSPTAGKLNGTNSLPSSQNSSSSSLSAKSTPQTQNSFFLNGHNHSNLFSKENDESTLTNSAGHQQQSATSSASSGVGGSTSSANDLNYTDSVENELIIYDIENWICGAQEIFIRLENEYGEEKASFRKTN